MSFSSLPLLGRQKLLETKTQEEFKQELVHRPQQLSVVNKKPLVEELEDSDQRRGKPLKCKDFFKAGKGVYDDLRPRLPLYPSDFTGRVTGKDRFLLKYTTTAIFLYIAILLPAIAFGLLNDENTRGEIDVQKTIVGQSIGGVIYALFAGSPLVIPLRTAPLPVFISVIRGICDDYDLDFDAFYACIGLWNSLFLILGSVFNLVLEHFLLAFDLRIGGTVLVTAERAIERDKEKKRECPRWPDLQVLFEKLTEMNTLSAVGLGFLLALLIFIDQNIVISLKHVPEHKLLKGTAFHWDLMLTGFINILMSCLGLPWMHAAFPHSFLHARQLAKVEQHVENGHLYTTIVSVKEIRLTLVVASILIGLSAFMLPVPLQWIPKPILYGLFLYIAATSLDGNQMVDRMALLLKEQMIQLIIVCVFGMHPLPYIKMVFPLLMILLVPVRKDCAGH
ncbi:hypothetical protein Q8A73_011035 [Channa argus]|nr:hypothetical protein Q8A73_011035 [Channa argus]